MINFTTLRSYSASWSQLTVIHWQALVLKKSVACAFPRIQRDTRFTASSCPDNAFQNVRVKYKLNLQKTSCSPPPNSTILTYFVSTKLYWKFKKGPLKNSNLYASPSRTRLNNSKSFWNLIFPRKLKLFRSSFWPNSSWISYRSLNILVGALGWFWLNKKLTEKSRLCGKRARQKLHLITWLHQLQYREDTF